MMMTSCCYYYERKKMLFLSLTTKNPIPLHLQTKKKTTFMFFSFSIFPLLSLMSCVLFIHFIFRNGSKLFLFILIFCCLFWVYRTKSDSALRRTQDIWWDGRCFWNETSSLPIITNPCSIYIECCNIDIEKKLIYGFITEIQKMEVVFLFLWRQTLLTGNHLNF